MSDIPVQTIKSLGTPDENGKVLEWLKETDPPKSEDINNISSLQPEFAEQVTTVGPEIINVQKEALIAPIETIATFPTQESGSEQLEKPKIAVGGENETIETLVTDDTTTIIADAEENLFLEEIEKEKSAHDGTN